MTTKAYESGRRDGYKAARDAHRQDVRHKKNEALPLLLADFPFDIDSDPHFLAALPDAKVTLMLGVRRVRGRGAPTKATVRALAEYGRGANAGVRAYLRSMPGRPMR